MDDFFEEPSRFRSTRSPHLKNIKCTLTIFFKSIAFRDMAHIWKEIYGQRKEMDGHIRVPTQPPEITPIPLLRMAEQTDIQSSIPTTFWAFLEQTPGPTEPGLATCFLLIFGFWFVVVVVATDDDGGGWDGLAYWVLFFYLFGACLLIFLEFEFCCVHTALSFHKALPTCGYSYCVSFIMTKPKAICG